MAIILDAAEITGKTFRGYLERALFTAVARLFPDEQFIYPAHNKPGIDFPNNMLPVQFPTSKGLFSRSKMDKWLKEKEAHAFISFTRTLKTSVRLNQLLIIHNEAALKDEKSITTATAIGITSAGLYKNFIAKYPQYISKISLLEVLLLPGNQIIDIPGIKNELTEGREYFINADFQLNKERLTALLKGFSAFKKMQQSNWKFVIVLRSADGISKEEAATLLSNYKYREDVVLTKAERLNEKIADAYALLSICEAEVFPVPVTEAIKLKTPVISVKTDTINQLYGDAIVYTKNANSEAVGEMLMMLYKGETFRKNLIKKIESSQLSPDLGNATDWLRRHLLK